MYSPLSIERRHEQRVEHPDVAHFGHTEHITFGTGFQEAHGYGNGGENPVPGSGNESEDVLLLGARSLATSTPFLQSSESRDSVMDTGRATTTSASREEGVFDGFVSPSPLHESRDSRTPQTVSLVYCVSFVISSVIGSGIFASPGIALSEVRSVGASFCLWVIGGFMAICSCLISAELGSSFPDQLADARFLYEAFGDVVSSTYIWTFLVILNTAGLSIQALIISDYLVPASVVGQRSVAITSVVIFTAIALAGVALEEKVQIGINSCRATLVAVFVAAAGVSLWRDPSTAYTNFFRGTFSGTRLKGVGNGLIAVLWACDGSGAIVALTPFMPKPNRDLPLALGIGMSIIMMAYMLLIMSYLCVLPAKDVAKSTDLANDVAKVAFGNIASLVVGVLVAFSVAGNLQSSLRYGALTLQGAAFRGKLPSWFAKGTTQPTGALLYMCTASILLILLGHGNVKILMNFFGVLVGIFVFLNAVAAIKLRFDKPFHTRHVLLPLPDGVGDVTEGERIEGVGEGAIYDGSDRVTSVAPFKMPLFPLPPLVILGLAIMLVTSAVMENHVSAVVSVILLLITYPIGRLLKQFRCLP